MAIDNPDFRPEMSEEQWAAEISLEKWHEWLREAPPDRFDLPVMQLRECLLGEENKNLFAILDAFARSEEPVDRFGAVEGLRAIMGEMDYDVALPVLRLLQNDPVPEIQAAARNMPRVDRHGFSERYPHTVRDPYDCPHPQGGFDFDII